MSEKELFLEFSGQIALEINHTIIFQKATNNQIECLSDNLILIVTFCMFFLATNDFTASTASVWFVCEDISEEFFVK